VTKKNVDEIIFFCPLDCQDVIQSSPEFDRLCHNISSTYQLQRRVRIMRQFLNQFGQRSELAKMIFFCPLDCQDVIRSSPESNRLCVNICPTYPLQRRVRIMRQFLNQFGQRSEMAQNHLFCFSVSKESRRRFGPSPPNSCRAFWHLL
jgi:hypothetical protein